MAIITVADLENLTQHDEWEGFGYLGERRHAIEKGMDPIEADRKAVAAANAEGLTIDELFEWANSKRGRWYGDCMFGCHGQHAEKYLPGAVL